MDISHDEDAEAQRYPTSQKWESLKSIMYDLYIKQGLSLQHIQRYMAARGHHATARMYKSRLRGWGFGKNTSKGDWQAVAILRDCAQAAGEDLRQVQIHNRIRRVSELDRHLRKHKISEVDFLDEAVKAGVSVPAHIRSIRESVRVVERGAAVEDVRKPIGNSNNHWTNEALTSLRAAPDFESPLPHALSLTAQDSSDSGRNALEDWHHRHYYPHAGSHNSEPPNKGSTNEKNVQLQFSNLPPLLSSFLGQAVDPTRGSVPVGSPYLDLSAMAGQVKVPYQTQHYQSQGTGATEIAGDAGDLSAYGLVSLAQNLEAPSEIERFYDRSEEFEQWRHISQQIQGIAGDQESWHLTSNVPLNFQFPMPVSVGIPDPTIHFAQTEKHHDFMGDVFMACMSDAARGADQEVDLAETWMEQAIIKLKVMCANQDPMFLVTNSMTLVWFQVHDTESRAESLIEKLSQATAIELGENSSIAIILEFMIAAAGKRLPNSRIELAGLRGAVGDFGARLGLEHPHTLVALYYMCFHMMRVDHQFAEAERELTKLYRSTSKILGKSSFQSVCVLATLSRAQSRQNKHHAALDTINQCLQEAPLGLNHPHRLELLMRKTLICWNLKDKLKPEEQNERLYWDAKIEQLYWIVARGRVATLGRYHQRTEAAHETLIDILVENGRYETDSVKGEALELLTKPQVAVSDYERWWRTMVPKDREGGDESPAPSAATA